MKYTDKVKRRIYYYVVANYKRIESDEFILGEIPWNYKCHMNSIQKVKEGKAQKVYACVAIGNSWKDIFIHFINQLEDGKYQDNTWGYTYEDNRYYLIREIAESEYKDIGNVFDSIRESLIKPNSTKFLRWLFKTGTEFI